MAALNFPEKARRIWAKDCEAAGFCVFRRSFTWQGGQSAVLRVSAGHYYALYINGEERSRLFHRYFNFAKQVQALEIGHMLREGENTVAVLAYGDGDNGLMAELRSDDELVLFTDENWRAIRCPSFERNAPGHALLFGIEEQFNAALWDENILSADFDDGAWPACETVEKPLHEWSGFALSDTCDLTWDTVYPKSAETVWLCRSRPGYRFGLRRRSTGVGMLFAAFTAAENGTLSLLSKNNAIACLSMDGERFPQTKIEFSAGTHLLCVTVFEHELEMLVSTQSDLTFGAWREASVQTASVEFPWHETATDVMSRTPEIDAFHACDNAAAVEALFAGKILTPDHLLPESSLFRTVTQEYFLSAGGFAGHPFKSTLTWRETSANLSVRHLERLCHGGKDPAVIHCPDSYDVQIVFDMGREYVGYLDMELDAPAGTVVDVQIFEFIDDLGPYYMENHNGFSYACREGRQRYISHYRRGGRYIAFHLRNASRPVNIYRLHMQHNAQPVEIKGDFMCDDPGLNAIYRMSRDTAELCMLDTYVDCPGHEQNFWVGDARITAIINLLQFGGYKFNQHCIRMVGQSLSPGYVERYAKGNPDFESGRFLSMAAFAGYPPASSLPMWSYLWVMQCYDHYLYTGDLNDLRENYGYVRQNMENSARLTNERGLLDYPGAWNLIEWANNDLSAYGETVANSLFMARGYELTAEMAAALGLESESSQYRQSAEKTRNAVNTYAWDNSRGAYVDTVRDEWAYERYVEYYRSLKKEPLAYEQYIACSRISEQTNALALLLECVPPDRMDAVKKIVFRAERMHYIFGAPNGRTIGAPDEAEAPDGIVAVGSPFFLFFTLGALFKNDRSRMAVDIIKHVWGDMLKEGINTCWETMRAHTGQRITRSIAHAWSAAPAVYLPECVLGIVPLKPGYTEFAVKPRDSGINWAKGKVATPYGPIEAEWRRDKKGRVSVVVNAPASCIYIVDQT